jgi:hypothetical protein
MSTAKMHGHKKGAALATAVALVLVAVAIAWPGRASASAMRATASSYTWSPTGWSNIRNYCPNTGCGILVSVANGTPVLMHCWVDAQWANGAYWTNRWFYAGVLTSYGEDATKVGWIHASLVRNQGWVPHC